jgi:group I intron endonuclease
MAYIYKITNLVNGKEYIGKTGLTIQKRFKQHIKDSAYTDGREKRPLYDAFNKYGIENFKIEQIEECNLEEVNEKEIYWINYYNTFHNGYNATLGGEGISTINYDEIVELFEQGLNLKEISNETGHDKEWISVILKSRGISNEEIQERKVKNQEKKVFRIDKQTNKILEEYPSVGKAAAWVVKNGYSTDTINGVGAHICQCCNNIRKTAYKFK